MKTDAKSIIDYTDRDRQQSGMIQQIVHIIDDDPGMRAALENLFGSVDQATRSYANAQSFLDSGGACGAGCIVLDVRLPGISGLDFLDRLNAAKVRMPVVFMTGHGDVPMSVRGMKAGAVDFLTKPFRDQDMLDAVGQALEKDRLAREQDGSVETVRSAYAQLSPREKEVMAMVVRGLMNKQIAHELGLSEITVKIHRGSAMRKMGARSLISLVKMSELLNLGQSLSR